MGDTDAPASFFVSTYTHILSMVGCMGLPSGRLVSDNTSSPNPVQSTASELRTSCGGDIKPTLSEAVIMTTIPVLSQPEITITNGRVVTTSIAIAEFFDKRHDDVLKKIRLMDCSTEFNARNFADVTYTDAKGEQRPMYQITKNGFVFLVMGFTGKKAAAFKEAYIAEFDRMEKQLWEQKQLALSSPAMNINFPLSWFSEHHPYATMNYVDRKVISLDASVLFDMPSPTMRILNELH
ncbi:Rha family transcriptional regulator, partial [Escherichia coli]|nr:Rha family transcriptional regulator [Escherichia coli]MCA2126362.1 Rha family transcriptional regulator [Escherichia coli]